MNNTIYIIKNNTGIVVGWTLGIGEASNYIKDKTDYSYEPINKIKI